MKKNVINRREFDGIICFGGEDWWYHNRGHNDIRFMREFAKKMPVLFINSIGLRIPHITGGAKNLSRIKRKLMSMRRGLVNVESSFWVMSPFLIPGQLGQVITSVFLSRQLKFAMRKVGIYCPLLWVVPPSAAPFLEKIPHIALVFQRSDRLELYHGTDHDLLNTYVKKLRFSADLTIYCNHALMNSEIDETRKVIFVDHGVEVPLFAEKGRGSFQEPIDVKKIGYPRVGFVGGLEPHTFDPDLFLDVVKLLPEVNFIMVGRSAFPDDWCVFKNVHFLGVKPLEAVADYMAACDVLIMPWNKSEWIRDCNPIKLKEYLAIGRPIVSTPFTELDYYPGLVRIAETAGAFAESVRECLLDAGDQKARRARVAGESWQEKARSIIHELSIQGIIYRH